MMFPKVLRPSAATRRIGQQMTLRLARQPGTAGDTLLLLGSACEIPTLGLSCLFYQVGRHFPEPSQNGLGCPGKNSNMGAGGIRV
jgi:hypothetical protein